MLFRSVAQRSLMLGVVSAVGSLGTPTVAVGVQSILSHADWHYGVGLYIVLALAMIPVAYMAGGVDKLPAPITERTSTPSFTPK